MERILLLFALIGAMWAVIWLIHQERSQQPGKPDASPFAMREGKDFMQNQSRGRSKNG